MNDELKITAVHRIPLAFATSKVSSRQPDTLFTITPTTVYISTTSVC
jgi:hypothetical protein